MLKESEICSCAVNAVNWLRNSANLTSFDQRKIIDFLGSPLPPASTIHLILGNITYFYITLMIHVFGLFYFPRSNMWAYQLVMHKGKLLFVASVSENVYIFLPSSKLFGYSSFFLYVIIASVFVTLLFYIKFFNRIFFYLISAPHRSSVSLCLRSANGLLVSPGLSSADAGTVSARNAGLHLWPIRLSARIHGVSKVLDFPVH